MIAPAPGLPRRGRGGYWRPSIPHSTNAAPRPADTNQLRPMLPPGRGPAEEPRGLLALVHPPLHELGSAAVGHEPDLPHVDERPRVRVGGVRVDGPSPDERRVAVDALDLVLERPRAGIVLASEPLAHDLL